MKIIYILPLLVGLCISCGTSPERDAKKMHYRQKTLLEIQAEAAADDSLNNEEIELITQAYRENIGFSKSILNKYKSDTAALNVYKTRLAALNQKIKTEQDSVIHALRTSKAYDKLQKALFELYFPSKK
ncbi:MAG: hypothetical protein ACQES1_07375 [Bacteroidota bacterium]